MAVAERIPLDGTKDEKVMTCLKAAGWYEGRCADITEVREFYRAFGIVLPAGAEKLLREYHGLADCWIMNDDGSNRSCDIEFTLYPTRICDEKYYRQESSAEESAEFRQRAERYAGEPLVWIGEIGYYYTSNVFMGSSDRIYTTPDYNDKVGCYSSIPELLADVFSHADKWHSVCVKHG